MNSYFSRAGERLRKQREDLRITQAEAAERCGVSREMWGKYERDKAVPRGDVLAKMAELGIDVAYVLSGDTIAARIVNATLKESTASAQRIPGTSEQQAAIRDADAQLMLASLVKLNEAETALITDFRACSPSDQESIRRHASALAAGTHAARKTRRGEKQ